MSGAHESRSGATGAGRSHSTIYETSGRPINSAAATIHVLLINVYIHVAAARDNRFRWTTVPQDSLDRESTGAYAYKHDCQCVSAFAPALRLREHAPGGAGHHSTVRRDATADGAPHHAIHIVTGPGANRCADDPERARRGPGARQYDAQPYAQPAGTGEVDSTRSGRRREGAPHRARSSGATRPRAGDPGVGAGAATAQGEARPARLGGVTGVADGRGEGTTAGMSAPLRRTRCYRNEIRSVKASRASVSAGPPAWGVRPGKSAPRRHSLAPLPSSPSATRKASPGSAGTCLPGLC